MRMWMVDPQTMCRKHLMGEHVETHMYVGGMLKGTKMGGYIAGNLLEPMSLKRRHDALAAEMVARGYKHDSVMGDNAYAAALASLPEEFVISTVSEKDARAELHRRCPDCAARWQQVEQRNQDHA